MSDGLLKKIGMFVLFAAFAAALSSCGRRGALQAPDFGISTDADIGIEKPIDSPKPDREFILDSLI